MFLASAGVAGIMAVTGGTITTPTGYQVNEFTASADLVVAVWTPSATGYMRGGVRTRSANRELVGGGGEAGLRAMGYPSGPGSGGQVETGSDTLVAGTYPVVVGAGGTGNTTQYGNDGADTTFNSHTALKGVGGGQAGGTGTNKDGRTGKNASGPSCLGATAGAAGTTSGGGQNSGTAVGDAVTSANRSSGGAGGSTGNGGNGTIGLGGTYGAGTTSVCPGKSDVLGEGGGGSTGSGGTNSTNTGGKGAGGNGQTGGTTSGEDGIIGVARIWFPTT